MGVLKNLKEIKHSLGFKSPLLHFHHRTPPPRFGRPFFGAANPSGLSS